jgi:hypothetical protein
LRSRGHPSRLFLTTKDGTPDRLPEALRENVERNVQLNRDLDLIWYGDKQCLALLNSTYPDAAELFQSLRHGANKADLCRAGYLAQYGGFYLDTDVQLKVPLSGLVGNSTEFLTLNEHSITLDFHQTGMNWAILGTAPDSPIMKFALDAMVANPPDDSPAGPNSWTVWGPRRLADAYSSACGGMSHYQVRSDVDIKCKVPSRFLYEENLKKLVNEFAARAGKNVKPGAPSFLRRSRAIPGMDVVRNALHRKRMNWEGLEYGIFAEGEHGHIDKLVGYSRFDDCNAWNCGSETVDTAVKWGDKPVPADK